jgi:hypothetical protein
MWWVIGIVIIAITAVVLFFLKDMSRTRRIRSEIREAYLEDGLPYDQADKVAWYLIDMFIYMRKKKDPNMAKMVIESTMTILNRRLYKNKAYKGRSRVKKQVDGIRDACLVLNRPVIEAADLMYSSFVSSYEEHMKKKNG